MKIQIDTDNKIIRIEEKIKLSELVEKLQKLIGDEWKEYTIDTSPIINWTNPITIPWTTPQAPFPVFPTYPDYPPTQPWITYYTSQAVNNSGESVLNVIF